MLVHLKTIFYFLLLLSINISAFAQAADSKKTVDDKAKNSSKRSKMTKVPKPLSPQQQQAIGIIGQLSGTAKFLDNQQSKILIRIRIAELLWKYDEPQARKLFEDVFQEANTAFSESQKEAKTKQQNFPQVSTEFQLLNTVLNAIVRHDRPWAENLRKTVTDVKVSMNQNSQSILAMQMATSLASSNPESAAQIALENLNNGFNPMIGGVLHELQHSNPALAEQVFAKALLAARNDPANTFINIRVLSNYVFPSLETDSLEAVLGRASEVTSINPTLVQQFLSFVYETVLSKAEGGTVDVMYARYKPSFDYQTIYQLLPFFEKYLPDRVGDVRAQLNEMSRTVPAPQLDSITNTNSQTRIDDLKNKADSAPLSMKDSLYTQAAMLASRNGSTDQALSIALSISIEKREDIISLIHYQAAMKAIGKEDFDDAYRHTQKITKEPRISSIIFSQIAKSLNQKKQNNKAIEFLKDAEIMIDKCASSPNKAYALLEITNEMVKLDITRGFEMLRSVVKAFNQAEFSIDNRNEAGKVIIGLSAIDFAPSFSKLAAQDFQRTLYLAQSLELKDASIMAQLAVCKGVLISSQTSDAEKKEDKSQFNKPTNTKNSNKSNQ